MTRKQEIVPVQLQDEKRTAHTQYRKQNPQKLVARLNGVDSELFIYEGIQEEILRVLNTALGIVHQCGTFVHCMRAKSPPSAKIIVQLYNLLYTYFMYEFSYK